MSAIDADDLEVLLARIRNQAKNEDIRLTVHAQEEMVAEEITLDQVLEAIANCEILENYPQHRRGGCCLLHGPTQNNRPLHVVCTTTQPLLIIITVYEPKPPKWITPAQRRRET